MSGRTHIPLRATIVFAAMAIALVPSRASAQNGPPDRTIEISPEPPPATAAAPAESPALERVQPEDEETAEDTGPVVAVQRSAASAEHERAAIDALWRRHLGVGATVGVGSPIGLFGAFVDVNIVPLMGVTLGGGGGGTFGPAVAGTVNVRPFRFGHFAPYVGVGISTNFLGDAYRNNPSIHVPANAWWLNLELGAEYRSASGLGLRLGVGFASLLNTGDFTNVPYQNFYGPQSNTDIGWDPVSAADAHDVGSPLFVPYVHFDAFGLFGF